ncbi:hypothetical protein [Solibacillus sp. NPDC093137]|uniref:hypothetical protein n=1 Tax=Solibacillus sp. NPDC093137 TaxID=3390678 RepID=UPI003D051296
MTDVVETPEQVEPVTEVIEWSGGLMTSAIRNMIGTPPPGFEFVEYAVGGAIFIILFALIASVVVGFSKILGAK